MIVRPPGPECPDSDSITPQTQPAGCFRSARITGGLGGFRPEERGAGAGVSGAADPPAEATRPD
jgi:hypothetical protein